MSPGFGRTWKAASTSPDRHSRVKLTAWGCALHNSAPPPPTTRPPSSKVGFWGAGSCSARVAFHLSIRYAEGQLIDRAMNAPGRSWVFWTMLTPTLGGLLSGVLLQYVVPDARGSGIPQVKVAYAVRGGKLSFTHSTVGKFLI